MKTRTNTKSGGTTYQHNETIAHSNAPKHSDRRNASQASAHGIRVMSIRTGIKAGWISRNYK